MPHWVTFTDMTMDCQEIHIKDQFGHWTNGYIRSFAHRLATVILDKVSKCKYES